MLPRLLCLLVLCIVGRSSTLERATVTSSTDAVPQHGHFEIALEISDFVADEDGTMPWLQNPYLVNLDAAWTHVTSGTRLSTHGFYDGQGLFRVRFSPSMVGAWNYITNCTDVTSLHGHIGKLEVSKAVTRGCPRTSGGKLGFVYPDGSKYSPVGTTCYAWLHQDIQGTGGQNPDGFEESTLRALKASPFNKLRMTGFPKYYPYTHHEPRFYPFQGRYVPSNSSCHPPYTACGRSSWDFTRFNLSFWRHFEKRVKDVAALGIVPEIILFHPYDSDHWGFDRINRRCGVAGSTSAAQCTENPHNCLWCDQHYIKYMVSRVSALGVWWSMANEWDLEKSKSELDWDILFLTLQAADPYDRERSIHNCVEYYNHSKSWVSHISLQGSTVQQLQMAKATWTTKPIVWDEVKYEGNITYGALTPMSYATVLQWVHHHTEYGYLENPFAR